MTPAFTPAYVFMVLVRVLLGAGVVAFGAFATSTAWSVLFDGDLPTSFALFAGLIMATLAMTAPMTPYVPEERRRYTDGILVAGALAPAPKTPGDAGASTERN